MHRIHNEMDRNLSCAEERIGGLGGGGGGGMEIKSQVGGGGGRRTQWNLRVRIST